MRWLPPGRSRAPLAELAGVLPEAPSDAAAAKRLLGELTRRAAGGRWHSPTQAEQATFAAATLLTALERRGGAAADPGAAEAGLDAMYDEADRPARFDAAAWREGARALHAALD
ncbi:MAG: hypothetical protein U5K43_11020 [Halofilum sp. (in: g-proteobacteria)]|nr:hypothetical protein [Halofilum sp. (in: g-proteobacteria)]